MATEMESSNEIAVIDKVKEILGDSAKFKPITVSKEVDPVSDLGNLLLSDLQPVDTKQFKSNKEIFLKNLARDNAQLLFNQIWELPIERVDSVVVAQLPETNTFLPREKPVPKPKPLTKWEEYAKKKGIENKKRSRMVWDKELDQWKPRYGYKKANDDQAQWCMEVPVNKDPNEDQFQKAKDVKKERVAKNEYQRLRNISKAQKAAGNKSAPLSSKLKPEVKKDKKRLTKEIDVAKVSTASMGKFQEKLPNEKPNKKTGKKRKFETVCGDMNDEKRRALDIFNKINKPNTLDMNKAINKKMAQDQQLNAMDKKNKKKGGSMKIKNRKYKGGKQASVDKMKAKTLGKKKRR